MYLRLVLISLIVLTFLPASAQDHVDSGCDIETLLAHQQEHAARLDDLAEMLEADMDNALEALYTTGIAYQLLATQCGFLQSDEAAAEHTMEHGMDAHTDNHDSVSERVLEVGDPVNGEQLFNTIQPKVGYACATCHRVDTTEKLIGPGLLGVGSPTHDPAEHAMDNDNEMAGMDMGGNHDMDAATEIDPVLYIRKSILNPGAFVVPGFPDNLMPKIYGDVFTDDEINDIIAYLLTLE